jgi:hypothetical protein
MTSTIRYLPPRGVDASAIYQRYYLSGFEATSRLVVDGLTSLTRLVPRAEQKVDIHRQAVRVVHKLRRRDRPNAHVGRYEASIGGRQVRFVIDASDPPGVDEPSLEWADTYFKANRWAGGDYDQKVLPIVNGNGILGRRQIELLRSLREAPKDVDVAFVSNVWGGREHNVRLFEALAGLGVRGDLQAIFPHGFDVEETASYIARLRSLGVAASTEAVAPRELWRRLARARIVFFRAGKHLCIPWRMLDLLAMGSAVVVDAPFQPEWPERLRAGVNFVDCGIARPLDTSPAGDEEYEKVGAAIEALLANDSTAEAIRAANARYFDEHAAPERVAAYVVGALEPPRGRTASAATVG